MTKLAIAVPGHQRTRAGADNHNASKGRFSPPLFPGRYVGHDQFGAGVVKAIEGNRITVDFGARGTRKMLASYLRAPTKGVLPYKPQAEPVMERLAALAGCGNIPFVVVDARIHQRVGVTVAAFVIESHVGGTLLTELEFFIEHHDPQVRGQHLSEFSEFSHSLGLTSPEDINEFLERKACLRIPKAGDFPVFSRLAA